jgi:hypothetical protein
MSQVVHNIHGILVRIDLISREVELISKAASHVVSVPPDCEVLLHGERVKLRMLQPGDSVKVTCLDKADSLVARALVAQSDESLLDAGYR